MARDIDTTEWPWLRALVCECVGRGERRIQKAPVLPPPHVNSGNEDTRSAVYVSV